MANSRDIELFIRARDFATKPINEIAAATDNLVSRVNEITPASARGEGSIKELEATLLSLGNALKRIKADSSLVESYRELSAQIAVAQADMERLRERAEKAKLAVTNAPTKDAALDQELKKATLEVDRQDKALRRLEASLANTGKKLAEVGIDTNNMAAAEALLASSADKAMSAIKQLDGAIASHAQNAAVAAARAKQLADAEAAQAAAVKKAADDSRARIAADSARVAARIKAEREYEAFWLNSLAEREAREKKAAETEVQYAKWVAQEKAAADARAAAASKARIEADNARVRERIRLQREYDQMGARLDAEDAARRVAFLTERERAWTTTAAQGVRVTKELGTAYRGAAASATTMWQALGLAERGERQSLSLMQRLRGQVLSVTASYVGLFGALQGVASVLTTVNDRNQVSAVFKTGFGENAGKEFEYVATQAERLGKNTFELAKSYGSFALAAKSAKLSSQDTRLVFEAMTEATTVLGKSSEDTALVFKAMEQIFSKGKVSMEELRGQLGDQLPAVMGTLSKALDIPLDKLQQMIEQGKLGADSMVAFARQVRQEYAGSLGEATNSTQAQMNRLTNAINDFKLAVADSGALAKFTEFVVKLTELLRSEDGKKFAQVLGTGLGLVFDVLKLVVENAQLLSNIFLIWGGVKVLGVIRGIGAALTGVAASMTAAGTAATGFAATLAVIGAELAPLATAVLAMGAAAKAGWDFGAWLSESFPVVRRFGVAMVQVFVEAFGSIKDAWTSFWETLGTDKSFWDAWQQKASERRAIFNQMYADIDAKTQEAQAPTKLGRNVRGTQARIEADAAKRRADEVGAAANAATLKAAEGLQARLSALRAENLKKDATTAEEYAAGIREQFKDLYNDIEAFGKEHDKKTAQRMKAQLDQIITVRERQAKSAFAETAAKNLADQISSGDSTRRALIAAAKERGEAKVDTPEKVDAEIKKINDQYRPKLTGMIDDLLTRIAQLPQKTQEEMAALVAQMQNLRDIGLQEKPDTSVYDDVLQKYAELKNASAVYTQDLKLQRDLLKTHSITQEQYRENVDAIQAAYAGAVQQAKDLAEFIETSGELTDAQRKSLGDELVTLSGMVKAYDAIAAAQDRTLRVQESVANALTKILIPTDEVMKSIHNIGDAWLAVRDAMRNYFADLLRNLAMEIVKRQVLKALQSTNFGGGWGELISTVVAGSFHSGGVVGQGGAPRAAMASWFSAAPRYHGGGVVGLRSDEVPAVLQKNEEVLTRNDPRNIMNGGASGSGGVAIHNFVDPESVVKAGLSTASGRRTILNVIRADKAAFKQALT